MQPTNQTGTQFYKGKDLKALIVHISAQAHKSLETLAELELLSMQKVSRAILEGTLKDHQRVLQLIAEFKKAEAKPSRTRSVLRAVKP